MKRRNPINAMYRGDDIRPKTETGRLRTRKKAAPGKDESFYLCQQVYSALKPLRDANDVTVRETKMYRR